MLKKITSLILCSFAITGFSSFITVDPKPQQKSQLKTIVIDAGHGLPNKNAEGRYSYESQITLDIALKLGERLKQVLPECRILYTRTDENLPNGLKDLNVANRYRAQYANDNNGDLFISIHVNSMPDRYERRIEGYKDETYYVYTGKGKKRKKIQKTRSVPIYKRYKVPCANRGTETYIWAVNKNDEKKKSISKKDEGEFGESDSTLFPDSPEANILASLRTKKYFDNSLRVATFVEEEFKKLGTRPSLGVKQRNEAGIWVLQATNMPSILVETGFICNYEEEDYINSEKGQNELTYAMMRAVLRYKLSLENATDSLSTGKQF
jgi:N-acetylmuramoyl-L-alanine amidase